MYIHAYTGRQKGKNHIAMKMKEFSFIFFPDSHERLKGSCESGLNGQQHIGNGSDLDGLQALQAVSVLDVRWRIARRSRAPKMTIDRYAVDRPSEYIDKQPLTNQNNRSKTLDRTKLKKGGCYEC